LIALVFGTEWFLSCLFRVIEGSQDTTYRDVLDLVERGMIIPLAAVAAP
jgi:hypothetical protein